MQLDAVDRYLKSLEQTPFFLAVGDSEYREAVNELNSRGFQRIALSDFCLGVDRVPDFDRLIDEIVMRESCNQGTEGADENLEASAKIFVVGIGEYLALRGEKFAQRQLTYLKNLQLKRGKVVLLLRGVAKQVCHMKKDDVRFDERRFCILKDSNSVAADSDCEVVIESYARDLVSPNRQIATGFQKLLALLEEGNERKICVQTQIRFTELPLLAVRRIDEAYLLVQRAIPGFDVPAECGNRENWNKLAAELGSSGSDFESLLKEKGVVEPLESVVDYVCRHTDYDSWIRFIALKFYCKRLRNEYLKYSVEKTSKSTDLLNVIIGSICDFHYNEVNFLAFYNARKEILKALGVDNATMSAFVSESRGNPQEKIYCLTDLTEVERREIISWIVDRYEKTGDFDVLRDELIKRCYPQLDEYLSPYSLNVGKLTEELTDYFAQYKWNKVVNVITEQFRQLVERYAQTPRIYNFLPTRDEIVEIKYNQRDTGKYDDVSLYWLDALGVEYLGFIMRRCLQHGLAPSIDIGRVELPTITSVNQKFYQNWEGHKYRADKRLDEIKHKPQDLFDFEKEPRPTHLARELQIISDVIEKIAADLRLGKHKCVILTSDHGASRLAVVAGQEEKYETDTRGEHSGRCCKTFDEAEKRALPFATEENGWLVLANYGRFKGSRKANVEVHGGASLEEVLVPVITLALQDDSVQIELPEQDIVASYKEAAHIRLFSKKELNASISVEVFDKNKRFLGGRYTAETCDRQNFETTLESVKRPGNYFLKVYLDGALYKDEFSLKVRGASVKKSLNATDDFFGN